MDMPITEMVVLQLQSTEGNLEETRSRHTSFIPFLGLYTHLKLGNLNAV